jgi:hypothetical protein
MGFRRTRAEAPDKYQEGGRNRKKENIRGIHTGGGWNRKREDEIPGIHTRGREE